ncbi:dTDP-4-dehydrorhamnose 3,5-epimerase [Bosea sp. 62]|uniref:dTDP-4-dehydrorhamnose 3,5-epimerase n=1 Tax=unclassified Bosea (in: a-proteobacteria) TaxID=2653178 RepID=UPI001250EF54|nr:MULTISPECIES: dTDP-4-dehydrorhamnose 3,5-epimerase [unclassified Bosea (in: a-proteobacteria)]CAD5287893.1 dTDP-4-dehydrorhamnose 3,5-epimerase [Bosea sp. 21B]CAD5290193.1 dTDP-4-dehydrorhamnose 3,5-epimerase [Bosea sp. 46]CAD5300960.1 dTDP-4-dehydrorhamnose 3,5-epimerase [Bosea sp. 7B]VVT60409.1 dTDP-4-dehydrorhamnose 3,5-epimerase [Bosea sp. EC-HK365B]VXA99163.1 dTDP-4-dehydrorhamnose 3,5-epimerase [Bosea sp. 62]
MSKFVFEPLAIPAVVLIKPKKFGDARGYFMETYSAEAFAAAGIDAAFVQDNQSLSATRGVVRGLHFQGPPAAQAKLIRVLKGAIFDVTVDIRVGSPSYGRWCATTLTAEGAEQLFVPRGFAHGFCTLEADTEVVYKVDGPYAPETEGGIAWNDPELAIDWPVAAAEAQLSGKDAVLPGFAGFASPFRYEAQP